MYNTISVIVPVYKVEQYIHRCVDSILAQTFRDFELILVDDGSPDNCPAICDEYAAKDSRVVVIHQKNGGLSAARNKGIDWTFSQSNSQWLTFIDSDDWVHPEYLQRLLDAAVEHNVSVSICNFIRTDGQSPDIPPCTFTPVLWNTEEFYYKHNVHATIACGKLYRKECFQDIRYPVGRIYEDGFVTHKLLFEHTHVVFIPATLYYYFRNSDSIMLSPFSIKKYDGLTAREERIAFFVSKGYQKLADFETCALKYEIAFFSIAARKQKIYNLVPTTYRMGWFKAMHIVRNSLTKDQFEWVMYPYHPHLVKIFAIIHKVKQIFTEKKDTE